jgi:hypothetical protein
LCRKPQQFDRNRAHQRPGRETSGFSSSIWLTCPSVLAQRV